MTTTELIIEEEKEAFKHCDRVRSMLVLSKVGVLVDIYIDKQLDLMRVEAPRFQPEVCRYSLYLKTYER